MTAAGRRNDTLADVRSRFPALAVRDAGRPRIYFDNPAGTQVPQQVIDRITAYYREANANYGGHFRTSQATTAQAATARERMAGFFNGASADEVVFGPNMTSLTYAISRALAPTFRPGDEILLTRMDHDGNVTPWVQLANRVGLSVRWLDFDTTTYRYDLTKLDTLISDRTRLAAINYASNITGTINDVESIVARLQPVGALSYVDAVQYAPHGVIDVQRLGCDFLVCSAYKFYGPHVGVLWGRQAVLDSLRPDKLRAAPERVPQRFETGCANSEGIAGLLGALDYYEWLGTTHASPAQRAAASGNTEAQRQMNAAKGWMCEQENRLTARLLAGFRDLPDLTVHGLTDGNELADRVSTVSVTIDGHDPATLARSLGERNVFVWSGHNYAVDVIDVLGCADRGGVLRFGPVHYNTDEEIDVVLEAVRDLVTRT